jgi:TonB family protein
MLAAALVAQESAPVDKSQPPVIRHAQAIASWDDYPDDALRRKEYGVVSVLLQVSSIGRVTVCTITERSGSASLDAATCDLVKSHGHFNPAKNASGAPITSEYRMSMSWGVGDHQPSTKIVLPLEVSAVPPGYRSPVQAQLMFDASGRISACEVKTTSGNGAADQATCAYAKQYVVMDAPKSGSSSVPAAAIRYLTARLSLAKVKPLRK